MPKLSKDIELKLKQHMDQIDNHGLEIIRAAVKIEHLLVVGVQQKLSNSIDARSIVGDSFSRLIKLAFALNVIQQKTYQSLVHFKNIRNDMAHKEKVDVLISDLLSLVQFLENPEFEIQSQGASKLQWHKTAINLLITQVHKEVAV